MSTADCYWLKIELESYWLSQWKWFSNGNYCFPFPLLYYCSITISKVFTMKDQKSVSFEQIAKAATDMLNNGITPSVRKLLTVTGGRTETVSEHLRDYNNKRSAEVLKMADELGSSAIAKLLASEVQIVVDRKNEKLHMLLAEMKEQRDEIIELMSELQQDASHQIEISEARSTHAINDANQKIASAVEDAVKAEAKIAEYAKIAQLAKQDAEGLVKMAETKSELLIVNAKSEADALVQAANKRADTAEQEAIILREQVKLLSVDQAKRQIEQGLHQQTLESHQKAVAELADERTKNTRLQIQLENQVTNIQRLTSENQDFRSDSKNLASLQGQYIELQKQFTQSQHSLSQSERERESLSVALRSK